MLSLNNLKPTFWSRKKSKRLGRWNWSWKWTYCWRWLKWQNSRSWWGVPPWFEWGQTPLFRRMPKLKGFSNAIFKVRYNIINVSDLEKLASKWITEVDKEVLLNNWIIRNKKLWVKLLWKWELTSKINVKIEKVSQSALKKVEWLWWKVELV